MALIKCKECGNEVSSEATVCVHCGVKLKDEVDTVSKASIEATYGFFLKYGNVLKIIMYIFAGIAVFGGLVTADETDGVSLISAIISAFVLIISGIVTEKMFQWMAYLLQSVHEINIKTKGTK